MLVVEQKELRRCLWERVSVIFVGRGECVPLEGDVMLLRALNFREGRSVNFLGAVNFPGRGERELGGPADFHSW